MTDTLSSRYRRRIEYEDGLFYQRTSLFLTANSILLVALSFSGDVRVGTLISVLGIAAALTWAVCSIQSSQVIRALTRKHIALAKSEGDEVEQVVRTQTLHAFGFAPTTLVALLPIAFILAWAIILRVRL